MAFKSFMGLVFLIMGGGPILPSVFFKDFCIPGGRVDAFRCVHLGYLQLIRPRKW
ncbi:hypothetical protein RHGRI_025844 [Rhododendron griersonianum]|uniref:Uncharacterized protein n=1 Tax=Rhododendron griersonianum TaxID=479676 RepID=A0AAV6IT04_9ERIC|nr:hypothetical protein RHGRI_025844 [Rhododendron griersonianum]